MRRMIGSALDSQHINIYAQTATVFAHADQIYYRGGRNGSWSVPDRGGVRIETNTDIAINLRIGAALISRSHESFLHSPSCCSSDIRCDRAFGGSFTSRSGVSEVE